jgi:membrane protease YdiL (CAAX protease family)
MFKQKFNNKIWGPIATVLIAIIAFLGSQIITGIFLDIYVRFNNWSPSQTLSWLNNSIVAIFAETLLTEAFLVIIILGFLKYRNVGLKTIGLYGKFILKDLSYVIFGFIAYFGIYVTIVTVLQKFISGFNVSQSQNLGIPSSAAGTDLYLIFIMLVILPPIAEEILFRGFLYSGLRAKMNKIIAALITSILFALPHLAESNSGILWVAGCDTFILSLVLVYVREKTDKLWASMAIHMLKNLLAFMSIYVLHSN